MARIIEFYVPQSSRRQLRATSSDTCREEEKPPSPAPHPQHQNQTELETNTASGVHTGSTSSLQCLGTRKWKSLQRWTVCGCCAHDPARNRIPTHRGTASVIRSRALGFNRGNSGLRAGGEPNGVVGDHRRPAARDPKITAQPCG
jgi:hypothetical protein